MARNTFSLEQFSKHVLCIDSAACGRQGEKEECDSFRDSTLWKQCQLIYFKKHKGRKKMRKKKRNLYFFIFL